jgi:hypothetical protein
MTYKFDLVSDNVSVAKAYQLVSYMQVKAILSYLHGRIIFPTQFDV